MTLHELISQASYLDAELDELVKIISLLDHDSLILRNDIGNTPLHSLAYRSFSNQMYKYKWKIILKLLLNI